MTITNLAVTPIAAQDILRLFDSMQRLGITEIFIKNHMNKHVRDLIDNWFYKRNHNVSEFKYVWGESNIFDSWSYVKDSDIGLLKITFTNIIL